MSNRDAFCDSCGLRPDTFIIVFLHHVPEYNLFLQENETTNSTLQHSTQKTLVLVSHYLSIIGSAKKNQNEKRTLHTEVK